MGDTPKRFAALTRVSTERQKETGESLAVQKEQIRTAVKQLGGKVTEWYGGQEHAMPGWEKKEIGRLLADAQKRCWDAVIVTDADRWSRDNTASREGLEVLDHHNIRFFIGASEYALHNPEQKLFLALSADIGCFYAENQNRKSMLSRINRAKRNYATGGKLPYGRTFDKETGVWGIDQDKRSLVSDVAQRYLAGESLAKLADEYAMNHSNLHKILTRRCGPEWSVKFDSDKLRIHEEVKIQIPELLPPETIKAILEKVEANTTYTHGQSKHGYLLSRMVFCEGCGYALFGQTNQNSRRYYRHAHARRGRQCHAVKAWVRADELEDAVLRHLFNTFGNPKAVEEAVNAAIPEPERARKLQDRLACLEQSIDKERKGRQRILSLVSKEATTEGEAEKQLRESKDKEDRFQQEYQQLAASLASVPTAEQITEVAKGVSSKFRRMSKAWHRLHIKKSVANSMFDQMTWKEKRDLVERVFSGKTMDGKRMGVYVSWTDGEKVRRRRKFRFAIRGHLIYRTGLGPMGPLEKKELTDPDYVDVESNAELLTKSALH